MAQDNDAGLSTTFSMLNVDAMEFVPGNFRKNAEAPIPSLSSPEDQPSGPPTPEEKVSSPAAQPPASLPIESVDMKENNGEWCIHLQNFLLYFFLVPHISVCMVFVAVCALYVVRVCDLRRQKFCIFFNVIQFTPVVCFNFCCYFTSFSLRNASFRQ